MKNLYLAMAVVVALSGGAAEAFCGFYVSGADQSLFNNATQVVLMREGTRTVLAMQNNYQGPPSDFAMVVPVPVVLKKENVKTLSADIFKKIDRLASPRLVEYWEQDPCQQPEYEVMKRRSMAPAKAMARESAGAPAADYGVTIEAQFVVGEYEVVVLSANDALGLDRWLRDNKYKIPAGAEPLFRPYIQQGWKFFVAKVNVEKVKFVDGMAALSPLRFHYDSEAFTLPIRLGLINANDKQDLIVHIIAKNQRYEVANYPNVTIPTNIDLHESAKMEFPDFYASLFDRTLKKTPGAVVTEYSWASNSCDPCPTPPLTEGDLMILGLDSLMPENAMPDIEVKNADKLSPQDKQFTEAMLANLRRQLMSRHGMNAYGFVLTRLHARYDKKSLGEDLVFKAAPPIAGGREFMKNGTELEQGAQPYSMNNFQGRYAVRHPWKGPVACANPQYGRWGGPPGGVMPPAAAAVGTAFVKRKPELASALAESPIEELGIKGKKPKAGVPLR
jgi:hypothetical protein